MEDCGFEKKSGSNRKRSCYTNEDLEHSCSFSFNFIKLHCSKAEVLLETHPQLKAVLQSIVIVNSPLSFHSHINKMTLVPCSLSLLRPSQSNPSLRNCSSVLPPLRHQRPPRNPLPLYCRLTHTHARAHTPRAEQISTYCNSMEEEEMSMLKISKIWTCSISLRDLAIK